MSRSLKTRAILICDSLQRDVRGLPTLRGLYPHRIVGATKPWVRDLTVYLAFENPQAISASISVRISSPNARYLSEATFDKASPFFDFEMSFSLFVDEEGLLEVEWKIAGGRWRKGPSLDLQFAKNAEVLGPNATDLVQNYHEIRTSTNEILDRMEFSSMRLRYGISTLGD